MTREEARNRASKLDNRINAEICGKIYDSPTSMLTKIRAYLLRRSAEMDTRNNAIQLLKFSQADKNVAFIALGPPLDKGPTAQHFHFDSGARLSFGVALRQRGHGSELISFRFHYQLPRGKAPEYLRFDLNPGLHEDGLSEPRCHLHPGMEDARLPSSLHDPIEILDRIFFVLERCMQE